MMAINSLLGADEQHGGCIDCLVGPLLTSRQVSLQLLRRFVNIRLEFEKDVELPSLNTCFKLMGNVFCKIIMIYYVSRT